MDIAVSLQCRREMRTCATGLTVKAGWCPAKDGPPDSRHMPLHLRAAPREHTGRKSWKRLQLITLQLFFAQNVQKLFYLSPAMDRGELLYSVVSPAVGFYFWYAHKTGDISKVNSHIDRLMTGTQNTQNAM